MRRFEIDFSEFQKALVFRNSNLALSALVALFVVAEGSAESNNQVEKINHLTMDHSVTICRILLN